MGSTLVKRVNTAIYIYTFQHISSLKVKAEYIQIRCRNSLQVQVLLTKYIGLFIFYGY